MSPLHTFVKGIGVAWRRWADTMSSAPHAQNQSLEKDAGEMPSGGMLGRLPSLCVL